jgi:hypothetical protein
MERMTELTVELPTFIFLSEAADLYGFSREVLMWLIEDGTIRAARISGEIAVAEEDLKDLPDVPFPSDDMKGRGIRATEAIEKYKIASHSTLSGWRERGIVKTIARSHMNVVYDEYTVAVAAQAYHKAKNKQVFVIQSRHISNRLI